MFGILIQEQQSIDNAETHSQYHLLEFWWLATKDKCPRDKVIPSALLNTGRLLEFCEWATCHCHDEGHVVYHSRAITPLWWIGSSLSRKEPFVRGANNPWAISTSEFDRTTNQASQGDNAAWKHWSTRHLVCKSVDMKTQKLARESQWRRCDNFYLAASFRQTYSIQAP